MIVLFISLKIVRVVHFFIYFGEPGNGSIIIFFEAKQTYNIYITSCLGNNIRTCTVYAKINMLSLTLLFFLSFFIIRMIRT